MSEFSTLTTQLVTPLLKARGFTKHGRFTRSPTSDHATYRRGNVQVKLTFAFHPYDYPEWGIRLQTWKAGALVHDHLHPPKPGGAAAILRSIARDLRSRKELV